MSGIYHGKGISGGSAYGRLVVYQRQEQKINKRTVYNIGKEILRFQNAVYAADREVMKLYDKALKEMGQESAAIFYAHHMLLTDRDFLNSVINTVQNESVNAEFAIKKAAEHYAAVLSSFKDDYVQSRTADIEDIANRLINILSDSDRNQTQIGEDVIIISDDLTPSELVSLNSTSMLGIILRQGSANSHTAILARSRNIPTVIQADIHISTDLSTSYAYIDGDTGLICIDPEENWIKEYTKVKSLKNKNDQVVMPGENLLLDNNGPCKIYANVNSAEEAVTAAKHGARGIGLYRSEFLFIGRSEYPSEAEQFLAYKAAAEAMSGQRVILRTLDIGADKGAECFRLEREENPALGYRAIRICLDRKEIFKTQLRAMYRASAYCNIAIMLPMIVSVDEVKAAKKIMNEVKAELTEEKHSYHEVELGIMIETPAAAIISDLLASEVDFFSIGTNDLTQYTLAADRTNPKVSCVYDPHHPAILRMIKNVIDNAHEKGIRVGICGELASDLTVTEAFLHMGVDELSVSIQDILPLRKKISGLLKLRG